MPVQPYPLADNTASNVVLRLSFDLPEALPFIAHLRKTARCLIESVGISPQDTDDLEVVIGELATNAARHAGGGTYHVAIELLGTKAVIVVVDRGKGFAYSSASPFEAATLEDFPDGFEERIGGMGLPLVFSLVDSVDIQPNNPQGTMVRAEKNLAPPAGENIPPRS